MYKEAREIILSLYNAGRDVLMCGANDTTMKRLDNAINDKRIERFISGEYINKEVEVEALKYTLQDVLENGVGTARDGSYSAAIQRAYITSRKRDLGELW